MDESDDTPAKANRDDLPWFPGHDIPVSMLSRNEAKRLTQKIRKAGTTLWELLVEAHEKRAYAAMGYRTWEEWATAEFDFTTSSAYRALLRGQVVLELEAATALPRATVDSAVSQRQAKVLKPDLPAVVEEIRDAVQEGTEPAEAVRQSVAKRTTITPVRGDPGPPFNPIKTIDQIERPVVDPERNAIFLHEHHGGATIDPETGEILDAPPRADWQDRLTIPGAVEYLLLYSPSELNQQGPRDKIALLKHLLDLAIAEGNPRAARKLQRETVSVPPPDQSNGRTRPEGSLTRREVTPNFKKAAK